MSAEPNYDETPSESVEDEEKPHLEINGTEDHKTEVIFKMRGHLGFLPSICEFKDDVQKNFGEKRIIVGPLQFADLSSDELFRCMQVSSDFTVKFVKSDTDDTFIGYLVLNYASKDDAIAQCDVLRKINGESSVVHLCPTDNQLPIADFLPVDHKNKLESFKNHEKVLVIQALPEGATEDHIREKIPSAVHVMIPHSFVTNCQKGYAYVQMNSREEAKGLEFTKINFDNFSCKLRMLEDIPQVDDVITQLQKAKNVLARTDSIDVEIREKIRRFYRFGVHYDHVDYLDNKTTAKLKELLPPIKLFVNAGGLQENRISSFHTNKRPSHQGSPSIIDSKRSRMTSNQNQWDFGNVPSMDNNLSDAMATMTMGMMTTMQNMMTRMNQIQQPSNHGHFGMNNMSSNFNKTTNRNVIDSRGFSSHDRGSYSGVRNSMNTNYYGNNSRSYSNSRGK